MSNVNLSFSDPVRDLETAVFWKEVYRYDNYYLPPIALRSLAKVAKLGANGSCIRFRSGEVTKAFQPSDVISLDDFRKAELDFRSTGNCYFQKIRNKSGRLLKLKHIYAVNIRRMSANQFCLLLPNYQKIEFKEDEILAIQEYDTEQSLYGVPDWLGGMQSVLLNDDATLFRRRFYQNGSHLGYLLVTSGALDATAQKSIADALANGKGPGNFKSMHLHLPQGNKDSVDLQTVGDASRKDDFAAVKNISTGDVLLAHRVHRELVGGMDGSNSYSGDLNKRLNIYRTTEVASMILTYKAINKQLPKHAHFKFQIQEA